MKKQSVIAVLACAAISGVASADVVTIDFDALTAPTSVTEQYAGQGVHFSTVPVFDIGGTFHNSVEVFGFGFAGYGTNAAGMWGNPVTVTFDNDVSNFSVLMADTEGGTFLGSVRAFDSGGNEVGFTSASTGGYNTPFFYEQTLSLNVGGIRSVVLLTDSDGAVFDNLTFTRVPAPSTGALAVLGLGLVRRRR